MDISIIILSYNTRALTVGCVQSVARALQKESIQGEIIIVDNHSSDDSISALQHTIKDFPTVPIQIIASPDNLGFTKGNNFAKMVDYYMQLKSVKPSNACFSLFG